MINKINANKNDLKNYLLNTSSVTLSLEQEIDKIIEITTILVKAINKNGKILVAGNGGSSSDAEHFVGELLCTYKNPKRRGFPAISLASNNAAVTAWANDFGYDSYFFRQLKSLGGKKDVLFLISTGGGDLKNKFSLNLVNAALEAKKMGICVISLIGKSGGELQKISDHYIKIKSSVTSHIQESHMVILHMICEIIDNIND